MKTIYTREYESPAGILLLGSLENRLCLCDWKFRRNREAVDRRICRILGGEYREGNSPVLDEAARELTAYFSGSRNELKTPLLPAGTEFQNRVWKELKAIPRGTTLSYLELAGRIDSAGSVRASASAVGANGLSIFIPCHRVIGKNGKLTGYAGGLDAKKMLLDIENRD